VQVVDELFAKSGLPLPPVRDWLMPMDSRLRVTSHPCRRFRTWRLLGGSDQRDGARGGECNCSLDQWRRLAAREPSLSPSSMPTSWMPVVEIAW